MDTRITSTVQQLDISEEELIRALSAAEATQENEPGWFTVEEILERSNMGVTTLRRRLKGMVAAGSVEYKKVTRVSLIGSRYHCIGFRTKKE